MNNYPDSKVHQANMGPIWGRQDPGGPHVGPMNFANWVVLNGAQSTHMRRLVSLFNVVTCCIYMCATIFLWKFAQLTQLSFYPRHLQPLTERHLSLYLCCSYFSDIFYSSWYSSIYSMLNTVVSQRTKTLESLFPIKGKLRPMFCYMC